MKQSESFSDSMFKKFYLCFLWHMWKSEERLKNQCLASTLFEVQDREVFLFFLLPLKSRKSNLWASPESPVSVPIICRSPLVTQLHYNRFEESTLRTSYVWDKNFKSWDIAPVLASICFGFCFILLSQVEEKFDL